MPFVATFILGIVLGTALGGRPNRLVNLQLPFGSGLLLLFVIQALARGRYGAGGWSISVAIAVWAATAMCITVICLAMRRPGATIVALGSASNALVVLMNEGMPVMAQGLAGRLPPMYHLADRRDLAVWLGDIMPVPGGYYMSVGDLLMLVGTCILLMTAMTEVDE